MSNKTSDKNVANVEELIQEYKTYNDLDGIQDLRPYIEVLEHILAELEQKDKRIQELEHLNISFEKGIKRLKNKIKEVEGVNKEEVAKMIAERLQKEYIPTQVVIEVINELKENIKYLGNDGLELTYKEEYQAQIQILQELLGGERK